MDSAKLNLLQKESLESLWDGPWFGVRKFLSFLYRSLVFFLWTLYCKCDRYVWVLGSLAQNFWPSATVSIPVLFILMVIRCNLASYLLSPASMPA